MEEKEVIVLNSIPLKTYIDCVKRAVNYAIISSPFTIDRMEIGDIPSKILNIAKGKVAENLFHCFCRQNGIEANFDACKTPFYQTDKRDFILNGMEWDIKNNFIYHQKPIFQNYTALPALIPNKHTKDQWNSCQQKKLSATTAVKVLFTFLKGAGLYNGKRGTFFLSTNLTIQQKHLLKNLHHKYAGLPLEKAPFSETNFWKQMNQRSRSQSHTYYNLHFRPYLIICGYADERYWDQFYDTRGKNFLNGTLITRITNRTCLLHKLPSFLSLFPHLHNDIKGGLFRSEIIID